MTVALSPEMTALRDLALGTSCAQWAQQQGWKLVRAGGELAGPCPVDGGKDRFSINLAKDIWNCRGCGVGGDVIFLVMHTENLKMRAACERITGRTIEAPPDPEEAARLAAQRAREAEAQAATAAQYREKARKDAYEIWKASAQQPLDVVRRYLDLRGLSGGSLDLSTFCSPASFALRCQPLRAYWNKGTKVHVGPAMLAPIVRPDGRFAGVHQTWIDLRQPKGKLSLTHDGEELPAKKVLGVKKGGAIRLLTPDGARRLVMGEGIETTLTAAAHAHQPDTAYWAGVDLGNMVGKAARPAAGGMVHDQPDMDDRDCFLPPDWVEELVYLCDGDEPDKHTVDKVTRGLRRAQRLRAEARVTRPELLPLRIMMVPPGEAGTDLNSIAMGEAAVEIDEGAEAAA